MKMTNLFGKSVVSIAVCAACFAAFAAENGRTGRVGVVNTPQASPRMPTMPTMSLNTIGNTAVTTVNQPVDPSGNNYVPPTPPTPPTPKCQDGTEKDSKYTVTMCMNDIRSCVENGALQGGLRDMFNEDVRNSIIGGMKLCQEQVDRCIKEVRIDCRNIYIYNNDVWLDFNSRVVQPEYYNFVLRKTGLTPNQAENTCLLLDRNTYGSSFAAVSDRNAVNTEYEKRVGAYNKAENGILSKDNPQGAEINRDGYDGNRGHYARWDATNAECLIRVAAYNKDKLITNSWLFGAVGDKNPAEVWEKVGSTFTCNKDLFDFSSLLNDTKTAAVIGVGGGAVLGTAVGAAAGAGVAANKANPKDERAKHCGSWSFRKELKNKIQRDKNMYVVSEYLYVTSPKKDANGKLMDYSTEYTPAEYSKVFETAQSVNDLSKDQCEKLYDISNKLNLYKRQIKECKENFYDINEIVVEKVARSSNKTAVGEITIQTAEDGVTPEMCFKIGSSLSCSTVEKNIDTERVKIYSNSCRFKPLYLYDNVVTCGQRENGCLAVQQIEYQIREVESLLADLGIGDDSGEDVDKGKEIGKGAAIGLATGAAAGGIATAITALVERGNITCKVGDGLASVSLGKAHNIDSLKDFYVKWNLNLPDSIYPTGAVLDMESWYQACTQFNSRLSECPNVKIHYKKNKDDKNYTLVNSACKLSGNMCIVNDSVARSYGVIKD